MSNNNEQKLHTYMYENMYICFIVLSSSTPPSPFFILCVLCCVFITLSFAISIFFLLFLENHRDSINLIVTEQKALLFFCLILFFSPFLFSHFTCGAF